MTRIWTVGEVPEGNFPTKDWAQWAEDLDAILGSLMDLGTKRKIHRAHRKVLHQHEDVEGKEIRDGTLIVHHWMQENYADSMLIGLRRIVDKSGGSFSFVRLLGQLEKERPLITLDRYLQRWTEEQRSRDSSFPQMLFSRFSSDGRTLDRTKIRIDIDELLADHDILLKYINSAIAHRARKSRGLVLGPSPNVTWADLDRLYEDITSLFNKYYALVKPGVHVDFESVLPAGYERAFHRMVSLDA